MSTSMEEVQVELQTQAAPDAHPSSMAENMAQRVQEVLNEGDASSGSNTRVEDNPLSQVPSGRTPEVQFVGQTNQTPVPAVVVDIDKADATTSAVSTIQPKKKSKLRIKDLAKVAFAAHPVEKLSKVKDKAEHRAQAKALGVKGKEAKAAYKEAQAPKKYSKWDEIRKHISPEAQQAAAKAQTMRGLEKIVSLQQKFVGNEHRKKLLKRLEKKKEGEYDGFLDHLNNELAITGELIFDWFTPKKAGHHSIWWSVIFMLAVFNVFFYMAAEYPYWLQLHGINLADYPERTPSGPNAMWEWISPGTSAEWRVFDIRMLYDWGGRYGPAFVAGEHWRWFTSIFVHESARHLFSNMNLYILLSIHLEAKYGTFCVFFIWLMAGVGGNLFSAMFEDSCDLVVGASGAVFGMFGLFTADMALNFETIHRPILRISGLLAFFIYFLYTVFTEGSTSHYSHAGGFLCGLFPSFLFLPNFKAEKWEMILPYLGAIVVIMTFIIFPTIVYTAKFKDLDCFPNYANQTEMLMHHHLMHR